MADASATLASLRRQLAERFPTATRVAGRRLLTGLTTFDEITGGLPLAAVTEVVCAAPSCGSHLLLGQLLAITRATRTRVALVDAMDGFDPESFSEDLLVHVVWVRCPEKPVSPEMSAARARQNSRTSIALQAADLLARDANLGLVVLDLRHAPEADLRRIPGPQWYRFQRAVETTDLALVVLTPRPSVPSAQLRLVLSTTHSFQALGRERPALAAELTPVLQRQRLQTASAG